MRAFLQIALAMSLSLAVLAAVFLPSSSSYISSTVTVTNPPGASLRHRTLSSSRPASSSLSFVYHGVPALPIKTNTGYPSPHRRRGDRCHHPAQYRRPMRVRGRIVSSGGLEPEKQADDAKKTKTEEYDAVVSQVMEKARKAVFPNGYPESEVTLQGTETRSGKVTEFKVSMGSDGRFLNSRLVANTEDKVEGKTFWAGTVERGALDASLSQSQVLLNYTFDASSSRVWKTDYSGLTRELDLDDKELIIFQTLIPTGYWMIPEVTKLFDIRTVGSYKTESGREIERLELRLKSTELESVRGLPRDNELIQARLHIDTGSGLPIRAVVRAFGTSETYTFDSKAYERAENGMKVPMEYQLLNDMGSAETKILQAKVTSEPKASSSSSFDIPSETALTPDDTIFEGEGGPVSVVNTYGGHLLVNVKIGGIDAGLWLLDTGCGGMVLDQRQASLLGLTQFGEVYASVIGGTLRTSMCRANQMTVGPMTIKNPLFACMDLSGLLENYDVSGILGYDFFRRAVISGTVPEIFGEEPSLSLWDPKQYYPITPPGEEPMVFDPLVFLEDTPHIESKIWAADDVLKERVSRELLMLDIGAGESAAIFSDSTVRQNRLGAGLEAGNAMAALSGGKVEADNFVLGGLSVCGQNFERKPSRCVQSEELSLAKRAGGAICAKMLSGCRFVVDYPRKRFGIKIIPKTLGARFRGLMDALYGDL